MDKMVFGDRYKVTERIGVGGMAEVFKASDTTLGRTVAVKVMLPQYASDRTFAARFRQEAQAAANLTSPYIVNIYDWGKDDDMYYIVMEYVRGTDLKSAVQTRGSIHPRKVAEIGSQVCSALSVAHSYGIIHRDIKSANIMVQTDGNVKVMDFGIAQAGNSDMTQDTNVLGTAHYVSPEQAQGKPLAGTSDLYSLGVVMYEACTGQLPFDGPDAVSVAMKQVSEDPIPPRAINSAIDPTLEAIILKAMDKNPAQRFATANEMKQALDDFLAGRGGGNSAAVTTVMNTGASAAGVTRVIDPVEGGKKGVVSNTYDSGRGGKGEKKGGKGKIIAVIIVILLLAAAAGGVVFMQKSKAEQVIVPDVSGVTLEVATETLAKYGLEVGEVDYQDSETVEKDLVIFQDPMANDALEKGGKVNLTISKGKGEGAMISVPNLLGLTDEQARATLTEAGFIPSSSEGFSDDYKAGQIFAQEPAATTKAAKGSTVVYKISQGKSNTNVKISNYIGQDAQSAKEDLESQGLVVTLKDGYSDNVGSGEVMDQSIPSGTSVGEGTAITLTVCQGSKSVTIPNVMGMGESKATSTLKNAGFQVVKSYDEGDDGKVISQTPSGGKGKAGDTITLVIGTGVDDDDPEE